MMKFDLLPNEILIECFEYLNGYDIFHSFDRLNHRLDVLIRNIPLYFDFESVITRKFYKKIICDPNVQQNIHSIHLSNKNGNDQFDRIIRQCSLNQFPRLRSLTLTGVKVEQIQKLNEILPLISQLSYLHLIQPEQSFGKFLFKCPIRTLAITDFSENLLFTNQTSSITHVTLTDCYFSSLRLIMKNLPMLKYLKCKTMSVKNYENSLFEDDGQCIHLNELILIEFRHTFLHVQSLIQLTPNLKRLTISSGYDQEMIDAYRWEELITTFLPRLTHFQFKFQISRSQFDPENFKHFQTAFWHRWSVDYAMLRHSVEIYTVPYILHTYRLTDCLTRYSNNSNPFDNVTDLFILDQPIAKDFSCRFTRVTSLILTHSREFVNCSLNEYIESIKTMVYLSNLQSLDISNTHQMDMSYVLLEILKHAPNLSSLQISSSILKPILNNNELHEYLKKIIRKLTISGYSRYILKDPARLEQFCTIFSNIVQLKWEDCDSDYIPYFTDRLAKLSLIQIK